MFIGVLKLCTVASFWIHIPSRQCSSSHGLSAAGLYEGQLYRLPSSSQTMNGPKFTHLTIMCGMQCFRHFTNFTSSSRMHVIYHNWSATKQRPLPQSVAEISRHSVLSGDRIRQCETSSGSRHKDTDQCLKVAISFCRHRSVPVPCENGSAETTVAEGG